MSAPLQLTSVTTSLSPTTSSEDVYSALKLQHVRYGNPVASAGPEQEPLANPVRSAQPADIGTGRSVLVLHIHARSAAVGGLSRLLVRLDQSGVLQYN